MPYRRRYRRRRSRRSSVPWWKKKYSTADLAYKAYRSVKYLKTLVNVERKKHDVNLSVTSNGLVTALNHIAQGDTDATRDGNSIKSMSLSIKGYIQGNSSIDNGHVRVIVFKDRQQVADANPTAADLLDPDSGNNTYAPLNSATVGRFQILSDKRYAINNTLSTGANTFNISLFRKLKDHVRFNGALSSDIQRNGLYICFIHDFSATPPTLAATSRFTYVDN